MLASVEFESCRKYPPTVEYLTYSSPLSMVGSAVVEGAEEEVAMEKVEVNEVVSAEVLTCETLG